MEEFEYSLRRLTFNVDQKDLSRHRSTRTCSYCEIRTFANPLWIPWIKRRFP